MGSIIKLRKSDTDFCLDALDVLKERATNDGYTSIVYVAVNDENAEFFGKDLKNSDKVRILGAIELLKDSIISTMGTEE